MTGGEHVVNHLVHTQTEFLDITPLEQPLHQARVAREVLLDDVIDRNVAGQPARTIDFKAVVEHAHLDAPPAQPVVAMRNGVNERFAHGKWRVLGRLLPLQAGDDGADAHLLEDDLPRFLDQARQRAGNLLTTTIACLLAA